MVCAHLHFCGYIKWERGTQNMGLAAEIHNCWRNFLTSTCPYQELHGEPAAVAQLLLAWCLRQRGWITGTWVTLIKDSCPERVFFFLYLQAPYKENSPFPGSV